VGLIRELARITEVSVRTVRKALKFLEQRGVIEIRKGVMHRGRRHRRLYFVPHPQADPAESSSTHDFPSPQANRQELPPDNIANRQKLPDEKRPNRHEVPLNNKKKLSKNTSQTQHPISGRWWKEFERAWPWLVSENKKEAERLFGQLSKDDQRAAISAIPRFLEAMKETSRKFRQHANTFIRDRMFERCSKTRIVGESSGAAQENAQPNGPAKIRFVEHGTLAWDSATERYEQKHGRKPPIVSHPEQSGKRGWMFEAELLEDDGG
jgi:hypothetical protein